MIHRNMLIWTINIISEPYSAPLVAKSPSPSWLRRHSIASDNSLFTIVTPAKQNIHSCTIEIRMYPTAITYATKYQLCVSWRQVAHRTIKTLACWCLQAVNCSQIYDYELHMSRSCTSQEGMQAETDFSWAIRYILHTTGLITHIHIQSGQSLEHWACQWTHHVSNS